MELSLIDKSSGSVTVHNDNIKKSYSVTTYHDREAYGKPTRYDTWSIVINVRQLQADMHAQYQREKNELSELNQRFYLIIDRVQQLESLNSQYLAQIADFYQNSSGISRIGVSQGNEQYLHLHSDLTTLSFAKVDYEVDVELLQLQIGMYGQLIDGEQQWQGKERSKLEQELSRLASTLLSLRTSYAALGQEIESLYAARGDTFKQYLQVAHSWCNVKKHRKQSDWSLQTLKQDIVFYKNISSYSQQ